MTQDMNKAFALIEAATNAVKAAQDAGLGNDPNVVALAAALPQVTPAAPVAPPPTFQVNVTGTIGGFTSQAQADGAARQIEAELRRQSGQVSRYFAGTTLTSLNVGGSQTEG